MRVLHCDGEEWIASVRSVLGGCRCALASRYGNSTVRPLRNLPDGVRLHSEFHPLLGSFYAAPP